MSQIETMLFPLTFTKSTLMLLIFVLFLSVVTRLLVLAKQVFLQVSGILLDEQKLIENSLHFFCYSIPLRMYLQGIIYRKGMILGHD